MLEEERRADSQVVLRDGVRMAMAAAAEDGVRSAWGRAEATSEGTAAVKGEGLTAAAAAVDWRPGAPRGGMRVGT